jgi:hypothetical protein
MFIDFVSMKQALNLVLSGSFQSGFVRGFVTDCDKSILSGSGYCWLLSAFFWKDVDSVSGVLIFLICAARAFINVSRRRVDKHRSFISSCRREKPDMMGEQSKSLVLL